MKRIVFYEPATYHPHVYKHFHLPRLGSIVLGTILKKAGYDVKVFVEDVRAPKMEDLLAADLVGISTISSTAPRAYKVAEALRARGVPAVLGGPHVTFATEEALEHADYVFRGEAENSIVALVKAIGTGEGLDLVPGLSFRRDGEIHHNCPAEPVHDLDELPVPDFDLLHGNFQIAWNHKLVPMQTSRGCPHDCTFCSVTKMFGRKVRYRSVGRVLDELSSMDLRRRHVFFYDDHFAASHKRLRAICEGIIERDLGFEWSAQVRVDLARNEDLVRLMRRAGCGYLYIGVESVNPETLAAYNKGQTVEDIEHAIRLFHRHRIRVHGMFVLGADTDTVETVRATTRFAQKMRIETVQFLIVTPLRGTPFFEKLEKEGRIGITDYSFYDGHHVVFEPARMSAYELQREVFRAHATFYSLPRIIEEIVRLRFLEAILKLYARRVERRLERLHGWFLDGLKDGLVSARNLIESRRILQLTSHS